jgi:transcription antitermination factor NusG
LSNTKRWYVVYTKPRWEKKVAALLVEKGIENYCPLNRVNRKWSDRNKVILEPLFKGYLLVAPVNMDKWDLKHIPGIVNFVYWLGKPAVVREEEINIIKKFLQEFDDVVVSEIAAGINDEVEVKQGLFMNFKGIVIELLGNKAKVKIKGLGMELNAIFDRTNLEKVGGE